MISGFIYNREIAQLKIAQEFHQEQIDRIEGRIEELEELAEKKDRGESIGDREFFDPDDWPPQFHIDNLESQLDFNLGQAYGFCDLDKQSQADLAKLAVDYELDKESVQNILNICRALGSLDGDRD